MSDHGTVSRYNNDRCRCELCRDAARAYRADYAARKAAGAPIRRYRRRPAYTPPTVERPGNPCNPGPVHGSSGTYSTGCRCELCAMAARDDSRLRRRGLSANQPAAPIGPLLKRLSIHLVIPVEQLSLEEIAEACGVTTRTVARWRSTGEIPHLHIDRIATHLGWHPAAIWGVDWWIDTTRQIDEEVA